MTRGAVADLAVPAPLGSLLPSIYQQLDPAALGFTEALDEVLAPIWAVLDCFDSYLDPAIAPMDFVDLLAAWVGLVPDRTWSEPQIRRMVAASVELYRWRGTRRGIEQLVEAYIGVPPRSVRDSGGVAVSMDPGAVPPGEATAEVRVDILVPRSVAVDQVRLLRLLQSSVPAHVRLAVDLRREEDGSGGDQAPPVAADPTADDAAAVDLRDQLAGTTGSPGSLDPGSGAAPTPPSPLPPPSPTPQDTPPPFGGSGDEEDPGP
jgi:phage tail-like protein